MIANVTPRRKRFVSVKIPLKSSKSLSENPEILNEHKLNLVCLYTSREIFAFSLVNQCGFAMVPNLNFTVFTVFLRFVSYLLRFHLASDWSRNNKHSKNFLWRSRFYGKDCNALMLFNYEQEHYYGVEAKHECMDTVFQATYCSTCFL